MATATIQPPKHLLPESKRLWATLVPRRIEWPERLALLQSALEARDRAETAREGVALNAMTSTTSSTGAVHVHPLVKVEKEARQQFIKAWSALGLHEGHTPEDIGLMYDGSNDWSDVEPDAVLSEAFA